MLLLAVLAIAASAGALSAVDYTGKFTLPVETKWGTATLPPGEYTFHFNMNVRPFMTKVSGEKGDVYVSAASSSEDKTGGESALILIRRGGKGIIRALHLAKEGLVFTYTAPKGEPPVMANEPQLIQRIPIVLAMR